MFRAIMAASGGAALALAMCVPASAADSKVKIQDFHFKNEQLQFCANGQHIGGNTCTSGNAAETSTDKTPASSAPAKLIRGQHTEFMWQGVSSAPAASSSPGGAGGKPKAF